MKNQLKLGMADPVVNIGFTSGEVIVETNHCLGGLHQPIHQMGAEKPAQPVTRFR